MLATMATVTSGLLSPNSYGLNPDQMAAKMTAAENNSYDGYGATDHPNPFGGDGSNTTDSEPDTSYHQNHRVMASTLPETEEPKRNKRKNFKPRCSSSNVTMVNQQQLSDSPPPNPLTSTLTECAANDNINNNVRRRKTMSTRRLVLDSRMYSPMDLSKPNDMSDNTSSESDGAAEDEECNIGVGNDVKIPSSFSIHNLSKPHVSDLTGVQHHQGQISDMREYAMNTMRELLGIYGLTSEVAESISRQLPIAAFSSGKIFENFTLNPVKSSNSPPSQPPTPPSTPLSPKSVLDFKQHPLAANASIPNLTITHNSSPQIPQNFTSKPLNLTGAPAHKSKSPYTNGLHGNDFAGFLGHPHDFRTDHELNKSGSDQKGGSRGIFPPTAAIQLPFGAQLKTELSNSPPPPLYEHQNPLNAMMAQSLQPTATSREATLMLNKSTTQMDYSKYVKKFSSSIECGNLYCKDLNYREHFHCLDCNSRVFIKKEEMIRHFKWHKKRDESLQHGFMRYSPLDDCSDRYTNCTHNKKQTHYHCIKENCDKVYISTSDVQMHANYHRKDSAIIQEGFQRYRATEECGASYCAFFGQRTTHFHCRRSGCRFTFKNKSDMEKHKSYHIKDEQLSRDGFKKFMKNEACPFDKCRFSKVCNHIHCIRPQCSYVLHSSGQLFSHKRKHERKDSELAYRKYKLAQSMMKTIQDGGSGSFLGRDYEMEGLNLSGFNQNSSMSNTESERTSPDYDESESAIDLTANDSNLDESNWTGDDFWRKHFQSFSGHEPCSEKCEYSFTDHYHCNLCDNTSFPNKESVWEHARNHEQQELVTEHYFVTVTPHLQQNGGGGNTPCDESCPHYRGKHYHCNVDTCREIILPSDKPFRRLEHYKMHEYSKKLSLTKDPLTMTHLATSIDGMFCRKRGRPPKNRVIEVWNDYVPMGGQSLLDSPQAIFTSFKLPKPSTTPSSSKEVEQQDSSDDNRSNTQSPTNNECGMQGFDIFKENTKCNDTLCPYLGSTHFHCNQNRCLYVTDKEEVLMMHSRDFHDNVEILDGFEFYDRNVDCRLEDCPSNKINRHFHCTRCNYSFVQYSTMAVHNAKHAEDDIRNVDVKTELDAEKSAINLADSNKVSVVKASGTFFPLSTLPTERKSPEICKNLPTDSNVSTTESVGSGSSTLYGPELSCSRPFCKLKRKYHYHCNLCNQAFSEMDRLVVHVAKHSTGALGLHSPEDNNNQQSQASSVSPTVKNEVKIAVAPLQSLQNPPALVMKSSEHQEAAPPYLASTFDAYTHFSNFPANLAQQFAFLPQQLYQNAAANSFMFQHSQLMQSPLLAGQHAFQADTMTNPLAAMAANLNKRSLSPHHDITPEQKKARIQNSMRILKDEPVPEGYLRFRFNEDCQYQHCGYREHQTHFHCQRQDCGYSFCDKTRFVQHTARHERLDTLMGGDFQQYRANVACGRPDCAYTTNLGSTQNKASHFHCLKCEFVCTDTNKVVAHRRQHQKLDSIQAAGFEKFTPSQQCRVQNCQHGGKQTHYHCLSCQYAVLGLAQMSAHKYRHMEG